MDWLKISSRNVDVLNECSLAGGNGKQGKWFPLPSLLSYESLVSVKEKTDKKRKKNTDRKKTQTERSSRYV